MRIGATIIRMTTIQQEYSIHAPLEEVWASLTKASIIEKWGAGPATFVAEVDGKFSLWGGDIYGKNTKVEPQKLLVQEWYSTSTPEQKYTVSFMLEKIESATKVTLIHENVLLQDEEDFAEGWASFYFEPIKALLET